MKAAVTGTTRGKRVLVVAGLAVAGAIGVATPALAGGAPTGKPEIVNPASCASIGGAYSSADRERTCTTLALTTADGQVVSARSGLMAASFPGGSAIDSVVGESLRRTVTETTTTRTQVAARPVTLTSEQRKVSSVVVPISCVYRAEYYQHGYIDRTTYEYVPGFERITNQPVDFALCEQRGVFVA